MALRLTTCFIFLIILILSIDAKRKGQSSSKSWFSRGSSSRSRPSSSEKSKTSYGWSFQKSSNKANTRNTEQKDVQKFLEREKASNTGSFFQPPVQSATSRPADPYNYGSSKKDRPTYGWNFEQPSLRENSKDTGSFFQPPVQSATSRTVDPFNQGSLKKDRPTYGWNFPHSSNKNNSRSTGSVFRSIRRQEVPNNTSKTYVQESTKKSNSSYGWNIEHRRQYPTNSTNKNQNFSGRNLFHTNNTGDYHRANQSYPGQNQGFLGSHNDNYNRSYNDRSFPYNPEVPHEHDADSNRKTTHVVVKSKSKEEPSLGEIAEEVAVEGVFAVLNELETRRHYGTRGRTQDYNSYPPNSQSGQPQTIHTENVYNNYYDKSSSNTQRQISNPPTSNDLDPKVPKVVDAVAHDIPLNTQNTTTTVPSTQPKAAPQTNEEIQFESPSGRNITLTEFQRLTEDLLAKDVNNVGKFTRIQLQSRKNNIDKNDYAPEPLFTIKDEAWSIPTIKAVLDLHDNYNMDAYVKEVLTADREKEENAFLDLILQTEVMKETMKFLVDGGYVKNDAAEFKKELRDIWFTQFARSNGEAGSSGFESSFLAEKFNSKIIGLHNWIYYAKMEAKGALNYFGYIKNIMLDEKTAMIKVQSSLNGIIQPFTFFFVGTSPEFEIALYTLCFYTFPNGRCPLKLAGKNIVIKSEIYASYIIDNETTSHKSHSNIWIYG